MGQSWCGGNNKESESKKCNIPVVIPRCSTCKFWTQNTFYDYEGAENDGFCSELGTEIDIELVTGWDGGYVDKIETKNTFGCTLHNVV